MSVEGVLSKLSQNALWTLEGDGYYLVGYKVKGLLHIFGMCRGDMVHVRSGWGLYRWLRRLDDKDLLERLDEVLSSGPDPVL